MSVKFIFKALIGTIILIVISCMFIEIFNIYISINQIKKFERISARQACILFSQETFKRDDTANTDLLENIKTNYGTTVVSSKFYEGNTPAEVYKNLFIDKIDTVNNSIKQATGSTIPWETYKSWKNADTDIYGQLYRENLVTPCNMGITYLDQETVNKMFKWNLCTVLKNNAQTKTNSTWNNGNNMVGPNYIDYKGFRVYINTIEISDITYKLYNLNDTSDSTAFYNATNIGKPGMSYVNYMKSKGIDISGERQYVSIAKVKYEMDIRYKGITPLKTIINFVNNKRVYGFNGKSYTSKGKNIGDIYLNKEASGKKLGGEFVYYIMR